MNTKTINIGNRTKAIELLIEIKNKNYGRIDIKIENLYLKKLNKFVDKNLFTKNDAYISAETLWSIMQDGPGEDIHHHHGLTESDVLDGLRSITDPHLIIQAEINRFLIVSLFISSFGLPLMIVVEINATLRNDNQASINKIVTIYPKDDIQGLIEKTPEKQLLYKKQEPIPSPSL